MLCLLALLLGLPCDLGPTMTETSTMLYDFSNPATVDDWYNVDDGVMGGISAGDWQITDDGTGVFSGTVSLENNGGFASVRTDVLLDLSAYDGIALRVRGDGQRYGFNLRDSYWTPVSHRYTFDTEADTWQTIRIPFEALGGTSFGRDIPNATLNRATITTVGFIISDKQAGPFRLEVASISLYQDETAEARNH